MFGIIRKLLFVAIIVAAFLLIRRSKIQKKKLALAVIIVLSLAVDFLSARFPPENLFMSFDSPESVFEYMSSGEIADVVYGNESCMVTYLENNGNYSHLIVAKDGEEYKIASDTVGEMVSNNTQYTVHRFADTNDYYTYCYTPGLEAGDDVIVTDDGGNEVDIGALAEGLYVCFYSDTYPEGYSVTVNGQRYEIG